MFGRGLTFKLRFVVTFCLVVGVLDFATPAASADVTWTKIYETVTPSRNNNSSSSEITYTSGYGKSGGAASSFVAAGTSWDLVKIRMELTRVADNQLYYTEVSFDKWSGATIAGLQFPDYVNTLINQRNVNNIVVSSNYSAIKTGSFALGRLEIWPYNYSQTVSGLSPAGNSSTFDWDDSYSIVADGHGSFQIHNLTDTQTIMSWNMHRPGTQDVGFGTRTTNDPDWTFAGNTEWSTTNFRVQVFVGTTITSSSINAPTISGAALKSKATTLTATASVAGKVTFYFGTKKIAGCSSIPTVNVSGVQTATCTFKPNTSGSNKYSAQLVPTSSTYTSSTSPITVVQIGRRTGSR